MFACPNASIACYSDHNWIGLTAEWHIRWNSRRIRQLAVARSILIETRAGTCRFLLNWSNQHIRAWTNLNGSNLTILSPNWRIWYAFFESKLLVNERVSYILHAQLCNSYYVSVWHISDPNRNKCAIIFEKRHKFS
jgi:hypothetical protein